MSETTQTLDLTPDEREALRFLIDRESATLLAPTNAHPRNQVWYVQAIKSLRDKF